MVILRQNWSRLNNQYRMKFQVDSTEDYIIMFKKSRITTHPSDVPIAIHLPHEASSPQHLTGISVPWITLWPGDLSN